MMTVANDYGLSGWSSWGYITPFVPIVDGRGPRRLHDHRGAAFRRRPWPGLVGMPKPSRPYPTRPRWPTHIVTSTAVKTTTTRPQDTSGHFGRVTVVPHRPRRVRQPQYIKQRRQAVVAASRWPANGRRRCGRRGCRRNPWSPPRRRCADWTPSGTHWRNRSSSSQIPLGTEAPCQTATCADDTRHTSNQNKELQ